MDDRRCDECGGPVGPDGWCPDCGDGPAADPDEWEGTGGVYDPVAEQAERELAAELRGDAKMDKWRDEEEVT